MCWLDCSALLIHCETVANGGKGPRPRGRPVSQKVKRQREAAIEALMVRFVDRGQVIRAVRAHEDESIKRLGTRTIDRYMDDIWKRWQESDAKPRSYRAAQHRRLISRLRNLAESRGDLKAAISAARLAMDLDGVLVERVHSTVQTVKRVDYGKLSAEDFDVLEGLWDKAKPDDDDEPR